MRTLRLATLATLLTATAFAAEPVEEPAVTADDRAHWSFRPPVRPSVPLARGEIRTPVDAFVLAKLNAAGIAPAGPADSLALVRRLTLDLTGLPPSPDEVEAFLRDERPDAYERLVERLLASPHYGERQALFWLDAVRFGESNGYEADGDRPHAWRYRDYVVKSFAADMPFDRFLTEQLAGDLLAEKHPKRRAELLIAAGMHRCGPVHVVGGNTDAEVGRQEVLTEMVQGVSAAFLGLTAHCARCHDHKFDPVSQADYYRLEAFFGRTYADEIDLADDDERAAYRKARDAWKTEADALKAKVAALDAPVRDRLRAAKLAALESKFREALDAKEPTKEQKRLAADAAPLLKVSWDEVVGAHTPADLAKRVALREQLHAVTARAPLPPAQAMTVRERGDAVTHVLKRGDVKRKLAVVRPAFPRVLTDTPPNPDSTLTRLDLAAWLARPDHPLTARVQVNRLWRQHFGRALVETPADLGRHGSKPTHPELLDWLATEFADPKIALDLPDGAKEERRAWSIQHMHRLIVRSAAYRRAVKADKTPDADPDNRLYWRQNRRRLEGEVVRDAILAVSGRLNREIGGPSVRVPLEPEVYALIFTEDEPDGLWPVTPDVRQHDRRSLYLFAKRNVRLPLFEAFDQPDRLSPCAARPVSTFAPQALILANGPFARSQAAHFAGLVWKEAGADSTRQAALACRRAFGRPPREAEAKLYADFLAAQTAEAKRRIDAGERVTAVAGVADADAAAGAALAELCLALVNANEFVYLP